MPEILVQLSAALLRGGIKATYNFPGFHSQELFSLLGGTITSTNEKIAYEAAWGRSQAGQPSVVTFKNVGLNDAADPFINSLLTGVGAGLVTVVFDDIELEGSQAILDSRHYFQFLGGLWFEPFDAKSAVLLAEVAPKISEVFNIPVVLRLTNKSMNLDDSLPGTGVLPSSEHILTLAKHCALDVSKLPDEPLVHPANAPQQQADLIKKNRAIQQFVNQLHAELNPNGLYGLTFIGYTSARADGHIVTLPVPNTGHSIESVFEVGTSMVADLLRLQTSRTITANTIGYNPKNRSRVIVSARYERLMAMLKPRFTYIAGDLGEYTKDTLQTLTHCLCFGSAASVAMGMHEAGVDALAITGDAAFYHSTKNCLAEASVRNIALHIVLLDNGGSQGTGGQKIPGTMPEDVRIIVCELDTMSDEELQEKVSEFCAVRSPVILKVNHSLI